MVSVGVVGVYGLVVASYTATTTNPAERVVTGTVSLANSGTAPLFSASDGDFAPGQAPRQRCVTVTYTGTLDAELRVYATPTIVNGNIFHSTIASDSSPGGDAFPSCASFTYEAYHWSGKLSTLPSGYAAGIPVPGPSGGAWRTGDSRAFSVWVEVADEDQTPGAYAQPVSASNFTLTWEARNL